MDTTVVLVRWCPLQVEEVMWVYAVSSSPHPHRAYPVTRRTPVADPSNSDAAAGFDVTAELDVPALDTPGLGAARQWDRRGAGDGAAGTERGVTAELDAAVSDARGGDEAAFGMIFRTAQPGLLRYLRVLVGPDAEDVASETWLQISRDLSSFVGDWQGFRAWSITIARHRAIDHLRRQRRRADLAAPIEQFTDLPARDDPESDAVDSVSTDLAIALIAQLPREQAEAVMLRVVVGLDAKTSGRILGRRAGAVRTAAHRGLRHLARMLEHGVHLGEAAFERTADPHGSRNPR